MKTLAKRLQDDTNPYLHEIVQEVKDGLHPNSNVPQTKNSLLRSVLTIASELHNTILRNQEKINFQILRNTLNTNYTLQLQGETLTKAYDIIRQLSGRSRSFSIDANKPSNQNTPQYIAQPRC